MSRYQRAASVKCSLKKGSMDLSCCLIRTGCWWWGGGGEESAHCDQQRCHRRLSLSRSQKEKKGIWNLREETTNAQLLLNENTVRCEIRSLQRKNFFPLIRLKCEMQMKFSAKCWESFRAFQDQNYNQTLKISSFKRHGGTNQDKALSQPNNLLWSWLRRFREAASIIYSYRD